MTGSCSWRSGRMASCIPACWSGRFIAPVKGAGSQSRSGERSRCGSGVTWAFEPGMRPLFTLALHGVALFGRQGAGYLCGKGVLGVQVNSEKPLTLHGPEGGGDDGTPVAALRGPSRVAETLHQLHPRACDARYSPPGLRGLPGEPEPGERRDDDVE